jgi:hypothetical protein
MNDIKSILQTLMGVVQNYGGLLATRLFLGVAGTLRSHCQHELY